MACFNPVVAYRGRTVNAKTGKTPLVFSAREAAQADDPIKLPCGRCMDCRLSRSREWAIRCVHEAKMYERNCFVTLTFSDEHLPKSRSLDKRDLQLFMKRLRKERGAGVRFYGCGEYGEMCRVCGENKNVCHRVCGNWTPMPGRPHYHACLFNCDFDDRVLFKTRDEIRIDTSAELEKIWGLGFVTVGDVTFESAAYIARYITKKVTGERSKEHYEYVTEFGEVFDRIPEFTLMSRGSKKLGTGGIGRSFLNKYTTDVYPHDRVVIDGRKMRPPKYYDSIFDVANPSKMDDVKEARKFLRVVTAKDTTYERLRVREELQYLRFNLLKRGLDDGL